MVRTNVAALRCGSVARKIRDGGSRRTAEHRAAQAAWSKLGDGRGDKPQRGVGGDRVRPGRRHCLGDFEQPPLSPRRSKTKISGRISFGASGTMRARALLQREGGPFSTTRITRQRETADRKASQRSHNAPVLGFREADRHRITEVIESASDGAPPTTPPARS